MFRRGSSKSEEQWNGERLEFGQGVHERNQIPDGMGGRHPRAGRLRDQTPRWDQWDAMRCRRGDTKWNTPPPSGSIVVGRPQMHLPRLRPLTSPIMVFRHPHFYPNPGKRNLQLRSVNFSQPAFRVAEKVQQEDDPGRMQRTGASSRRAYRAHWVVTKCHSFQFPPLTGRHHLRRQPPNATIGDRLIKMADAHALPGPTTGGRSQSLQLAKGAVTRIGSSTCTR